MNTDTDHYKSLQPFKPHLYATHFQTSGRFPQARVNVISWSGYDVGHSGKAEASSWLSRPHQLPRSRTNKNCPAKTSGKAVWQMHSQLWLRLHAKHCNATAAVKAGSSMAQALGTLDGMEQQVSRDNEVGSGWCEGLGGGRDLSRATSRHFGQRQTT